MNDEKTLAESYRKRSEELGVIAELDSIRTTKQTLMNIAEDYKRLATTLDAIASTKDDWRDSLPPRPRSMPSIQIGNGVAKSREED